MAPEGISKYRGLIIVLLIVAFLVVPIAYFIFSTVTRSNKTEVALMVMPDDATITMNNTSVRPGTLFLDPGEYTVKAQKEGFASSETKEIVEEKTKKTIVVSLSPITDEAKRWVDQNNQKIKEFEGKAGKAAAEEGIDFRKKNPIVDALPAGTYLYRIGYRSDPSDPSGNSIIVTIDASSGFRNAALAKIRELGFDPAELKIQFNNYESPFKNE